MAKQPYVEGPHVVAQWSHAEDQRVSRAEVGRVLTCPYVAGRRVVAEQLQVEG